MLARIEDAGINASAPPEQLWVDGWLLRFSRGKAKRARCIQAVAEGGMPVPAKLARCWPVFREHGLWPYVRITPFSRPSGLDAELAALGMERIDETCVMTMPLSGSAEPDAASAGAAVSGVRFLSAGGAEFAAWVGAARGSTAAEVAAHAARIAASPVAHSALLATEAGGSALAGGQAVTEGDVVGLYDVYTAASSRGQGLATAVCSALLARAAGQGARVAYLQVDAANEAALRIYRRLGFTEGYRYHYRTPPGAPAGAH